MLKGWQNYNKIRGKSTAMQVFFFIRIFLSKFNFTRENLLNGMIFLMLSQK